MGGCGAPERTHAVIHRPSEQGRTELAPQGGKCGVDNGEHSPRNDVVKRLALGCTRMGRAESTGERHGCGGSRVTDTDMRA